jgi:hypothetical protein
VANSKIVRTQGSDAIGPNLIPIYLCQEYLSAACQQGAACQFLHANGSSSAGWNYIPLENRVNLDGVTPHEAGWSVQAYDNELTNFLDIPSQYVIQTHGSVNYATQFNDHGPTGKFRFQMCKDYSGRGGCANGGKCPYIHTHSSSFSASTSTAIHVNYVLDDVTSSRYPTLPAGLIFRVHDPNLRSQVKDVPSEVILRTHGSELYLANPQPRYRLQHCAHFYLKKICNRGPWCNFIHVADVDVEAPPGLPEDMPPLVGDYTNSPQQPDRPQPGKDEVVYRNDPYSTESTKVVMRKSPHLTHSPPMTPAPPM